MQKLPQRQGFFKKFAKAIVGFEVACFVATYAVYYKMNRNRGICKFNFFFNFKNDPFISLSKNFSSQKK